MRENTSTDLNDCQVSTTGRPIFGLEYDGVWSHWGSFRDTRRAWRGPFNYSIDLGAAKAFVSHTEGDTKGIEFLRFVFPLCEFIPHVIVIGVQVQPYTRENA